MAKATRPTRKCSQRSGVSFADVRKLGRELPDVEESTSYGTPALKLRGKLLARLKEDGQTLVVRTTFEDRQRLLAAGPDVFYLTDHYVSAPWILVRLSQIDAGFLRELLEEARRVAQ